MQYKTSFELRRWNAIELMGEGTLTDFARKVNMSVAQAAHSVGPNPVRGTGNNLARRMEIAYQRPVGWLDNDNFAFLSQVAADAIAGAAAKLRSDSIQCSASWGSVDDECVTFYCGGRRIPRQSSGLMVPRRPKTAFSLCVWCAGLMLLGASRSCSVDLP
jgi:hypothetical protein